jgi:hypothetical protein
MNLSSDQLCVEITTKDCTIPPYECVRLQASLSMLADMLRGAFDPVFRIDAAYHSDSNLYHVKSKLSWPDRTIVSRVQNLQLDTALEWCVRNVIDKIDAYQHCADRGNESATWRRQSHHRKAIARGFAGAYSKAEVHKPSESRVFRSLLDESKKWLRMQVGRLAHRNPKSPLRQSPPEKA